MLLQKAVDEFQALMEASYVLTTMTHALTSSDSQGHVNTVADSL
jgi:hypothetical protein